MAQASTKKLEHTGPAENERVASVPQRESSWQGRRSRLWQEEKEQSRLFRVPDPGGEGGESQGGREPHLSERVGGSEREHEEERVDSTVNKGRFQRGKKWQAKRASLEQVEGSMSG